MTVEHVQKVYNRQARYYDSVFGKVSHGGREMADYYLALFPGARLLEVGVGTGLSLPGLPRSTHITGIDLSENMLAKARQRLREERLSNVELIRMDATHLEFPDSCFDRVLAAYFITTVPDPIRVIEEMKRVCKPGGYLLFMNHFQYEVPVIRLLEKILSPLFYRIGFRTDLSASKLMRDAGLIIEFIEKLDFLGHWKAVRCINP